MRPVTIGGRRIGDNEPVFIIAEAGVNHNGDVNLARELIDVAKEAGADAVKFQAFEAEELVTRGAEKAGYQKQATGASESQFEMLKKLELSDREFEEISTCAREKGIIFLSTPFDRKSVDLLDGLGLPAFKVGSGEITNFPLLRYIAGKGKPIILSTGMATLGEIEEALEVIGKEGAKEIILLHCVSSYPASIEEMNLRAIETLKRAFELPTGLSDHTLGITIPIAAVAAGACVLEKHFTLDKSLPGPDHRASLEPAELKAMISAVRQVERAMGDGIKRPTRAEEENKKAVRRSIVAKINIPEGATIQEDMLKIVRPGTGIAPRYIDLLIGRKTKKDISAGEVLTWDQITWNS